MLAWAASASLIAVGPAFLATLIAIGLAAIGVWIRVQVVSMSESLRRAEARTEALQSELEQQRRSVDALADGLDTALFICDAKASILYANHTALGLFRFIDPIGRNLLAVTLSYDLEQLVVKASRNGEPQASELTIAYPVERIVAAKAWSPSNGSGRIFLTVYDATELRRLERIRQDFVANVSHELRTPMTLIRAMAETLHDEASENDELSQRYLPKIVAEVDRLSMISQDLLILSAAESNPVRKQVGDLADVVQSVVYQLGARARDKGLELRYEGPDELTLEANPAQMTQVAINLIENAINYTPAGSVTARLRVEGAYAVFQVADTGMGIASDHQKRVFERFYRVDKARARASGGTGLGLSIVKHIVEAHGGTVSLESSLNQGSTFTARIPLGNADAVEKQ